MQHNENKEREGDEFLRVDKKHEEFDEKREFRFSVRKEMKARSLKEKETWFQEQMNKKRINWKEGSEQLFLWRGNAISNCLSQLNEIDLRKVILCLQ